MKVEKIVENTARSRIVPKLEKKAFCFILMADSNMIGGKRIIRKTSANDFLIS
jgi:hypothetical protein